MISLDDAQASVARMPGPVLCVGAPGTGKTEVCRARFHDRAAKSGAHRVLFLVGTSRSALKLRTELTWELPGEAFQDLSVSTWDSFAWHLVSRYYRRLGFSSLPTLVGHARRAQIVASLLRDERESDWGDLAQALRSRAFAAEVADGLDSTFEPVTKIRDKYVAYLAQRNLIDADNLVEAAARLVASDVGVRTSLHSRFEYVIVDDAQNAPATGLVLLGTLESTDLFLAADFSCATALEAGDFSNLRCEQVHLAQNYRLTAEALAPAEALGTRGGIWHPSAPVARPGKVSLEVPWSEGESAYAVRTVLGKLASGSLPRDIAIICAGAVPAALHRSLERSGVDFVASRAQRSVAVTMLCEAVRCTDEIADESLSDVLSSSMFTGDVETIRGWRREAFVQNISFRTLIASGTHSAAYVNFETVLKSGQPPHLALAEAINELDWLQRLDENAVGEIEETIASVQQAFELDETLTLTQILDSLPKWRRVRPTLRDAVAVLSLSEAIGLEFECVVLMGMTARNIPRLSDLGATFEVGSAEVELKRAENIDRQRRDALLAITRARSDLMILVPSPGSRVQPSPYLFEAFGKLPTEPTGVASIASERELIGLAVRQAQAGSLSATTFLAELPSVDPSAWWWMRDFTVAPPLVPSGKLTTSFSRINKYQECPLRYVLESALGLDQTQSHAMKFGSLMHKIFEDADGPEPKIGTFDEAWEIIDRAFIDWHQHDYPSRATAGVYWKAAKSMLYRWWIHERDRNGFETVMTEFVFEDLEVDGHIIRGRIDRIQKNWENKLFLSDYKTGHYAATPSEARDALQLTIYWMAAQTNPELMAIGEVESMRLVYPDIPAGSRAPGDPDDVKAVAQSPRDAARNKEVLLDALHGASAERFDPSPRAKCDWCRMKPLCPRYPEGAEVPA